MATQVSPFTVVFPGWYDERAEYEFSMKGYLPEVEVHLEDGSWYQLYFYDPVRLAQDLEEEAKQNRPFLAEPGLVVIPEVTRASVQGAVAGLWQRGFFEHLKPLAGA